MVRFDLCAVHVPTSALYGPAEPIAPQQAAPRGPVSSRTTRLTRSRPPVPGETVCGQRDDLHLGTDQRRARLLLFCGILCVDLRLEQGHEGGLTVL